MALLSLLRMPGPLFMRRLTTPWSTRRFKSLNAQNIVEAVWPWADEPLGLPGTLGHGFALVDFHQTVGPKGRYRIERKLGWTHQSSIWLARDTTDESFVSIKILTSYDSELAVEDEEHRTYEYEALVRMSLSPVSAHCVHLRDSFILDGEEGEQHLCFVLSQILGGTIGIPADEEEMDCQFTKIHIPVDKHVTHCKFILRQILKGVAHLHAHGLVHTNLGIANIGFFSSMTTGDIERELEQNPPCLHPPEKSLRPKMTHVFPAASQPPPLPEGERIFQRTYHVGDLNEVQLVPKQPPLSFPNALGYIVPPELHLLANWNEKVDIWQFGCLVFHLLAHEELFYFLPMPEFGYRESQSMLWQMTCVTGETFPETLLSTARIWNEFFDANGDLLGNPPVDNARALESRLDSFEHMKGQEVVVSHACNFIRRCLRLDPEDRPSAAELLDDPWLAVVDE